MIKVSNGANVRLSPELVRDAKLERLHMLLESAAPDVGKPATARIRRIARWVSVSRLLLARVSMQGKTAAVQLALYDFGPDARTPMREGAARGAPDSKDFAAAVNVAVSSLSISDRVIGGRSDAFDPVTLPETGKSTSAEGGIPIWVWPVAAVAATAALAGVVLLGSHGGATLVVKLRACADIQIRVGQTESASRKATRRNERSECLQMRVQSLCIYAQALR